MFSKTVESMIQEAIAQGDFDNLPNKGKPIDLGSIKISRSGDFYYLIDLLAIDLHISHQSPETAHHLMSKIWVQKLRRTGAGYNLDAIFAT